MGGLVMADSTDTRPRRTGSQGLRPECSIGEHGYCRPGDVVTSYGDVVFTDHCSCACHRGAR